MNLRYISLWMNYCQYSGIDDKFGNKFNYNSRFVNNFISRQVREWNITTSDMNMISVALSKNIECNGVKLNPCDHVIAVEIRTTDQELAAYTIMEKKEQCEFYLHKLEQGYELAHSICNFDISKLYNIHALFRSLDYKNEWLFKKKTIKQYGIIVSLDCSLTYSEFNLLLSVHDAKTKELIERRSIYRTLPDEIFYSKRLKKAIFDMDKLLILDFLNKPVCEFYYRDLANGIITVNLLNQADIKFLYNENTQKEYDWIKA